MRQRGALPITPKPDVAEDQEPGLRTPMTERRCLRCLHWQSDADNAAAVEREFQMRFGPEVALVGMRGHPEHRRPVQLMFL
jgi:hypothetical protein